MAPQVTVTSDPTSEQVSQESPSDNTRCLNRGTGALDGHVKGFQESSDGRLFLRRGKGKDELTNVALVDGWVTRAALPRSQLPARLLAEGQMLGELGQQTVAAAAQDRKAGGTHHRVVRTPVGGCVGAEQWSDGADQRVSRPHDTSGAAGSVVELDRLDIGPVDHSFGHAPDIDVAEAKVRLGSTGQRLRIDAGDAGAVSVGGRPRRAVRGDGALNRRSRRHNRSRAARLLRIPARHAVVRWHPTARRAQWPPEDTVRARTCRRSVGCSG